MKRIKRIVCALLSMILLLMTACGPEYRVKPKVKDGEMIEMARSACEDLLAHWWVGDEKTGHFLPTRLGSEVPEDEMHIWETAQAIFALDSAYAMTGDESYHNRIAAEWQYLHNDTIYASYKCLTEVGSVYRAWQDDCGWHALMYLTFYRHTGDEVALEAAGDVVRNSYIFYRDGDLSRGLFYRNDYEEDRTKNLHVVSLMLAALEYLKYREDEALLKDTMTLYQWVEETLLRDGECLCVLQNGTVKNVYSDDMLYWFMYYQGKKGEVPESILIGPEGAYNPNMLEEGYGVTFLGGDMAMAVLHKRMFELTGEERYYTRAVETLRAINDNPYLIVNDVYNDSGDGWTNAAFVRFFVTEILTLPECQEKDIRILNATARSIMNNARTPDGYYSACWSGPAEDDADTVWGKMGWSHDKKTTCATSAHMVIAAGLAESMGLK